MARTGRPPKERLRTLTPNEHDALQVLALSRSAPADQIARAQQLLAVAQGSSLSQTAAQAHRRCRQAVACLVSRFNREGMPAVWGHHGGGPTIEYGPEQQERILQEFRRAPDREQDGTALWSLTTLQRALRRAPNGLPHVSTYVILQTLHRAGLSWQESRTWCPTGTVERKRKDGVHTVVDPDTPIKKGLIEQAYTSGEPAGIPVWNEDEAGPYQAIPQPGPSWQPEGEPARQPHEYIRGGTAKLLTLFHPATGEVRAQPVERATHDILHPWLRAELASILTTLPEVTAEHALDWGRRWSDWGWPDEYALRWGWPPVRMVLIWDNLVGHYTPEMVTWCHHQGIALLYTPLGGSWLNMAESVQRILVRRALAGQHPHEAQEIMDWLAATVRGWNADPTPFVWGGKRWERRQQMRERHRLGGSAAYALRPVRRRWQANELSKSVC